MELLIAPFGFHKLSVNKYLYFSTYLKVTLTRALKAKK